MQSIGKTPVQHYFGFKQEEELGVAAGGERARAFRKP